MTRTAGKPLPPTPLERAPRPELGAALIPKERYVSAEWDAREAEHLWPRTWLFAGFASDIPEAGTTSRSNWARSRSSSFGSRRARSGRSTTVCKHRGNRLREPGIGSADTFVCLYHAWRYRIDGTLDEALDAHPFPQGCAREGLDLTVVRCDTWSGFVFVCLRSARGVPARLPRRHPRAPRSVPLRGVQDPRRRHHRDRVQLEDLGRRVQRGVPHLGNASRHAWRQRRRRRADRLLRPAHPHAAQARRSEPAAPRPRKSQRRDPRSLPGDRGRGPPRASREAPTTYARRSPAAVREVQGPALGADFSELHDRQLVDDFHYTVFPNITFNIFGRSAWIFRPPSPSRRSQQDVLRLLQHRSVPHADVPRPDHAHYVLDDDLELDVVGGGGKLLNQDTYNLPRIQAGMRSRGFEGLFLGDQELRIRHFHKTLEDYVEDAGDRRARVMDLAAFEAGVAAFATAGGGGLSVALARGSDLLFTTALGRTRRTRPGSRWTRARASGAVRRQRC